MFQSVYRAFRSVSERVILFLQCFRTCNALSAVQKMLDVVQEASKKVQCVEKNIWLISDEAYRNIYYTYNGPTSILNISNDNVPGINGRRISIESVSKVWNACGLRIGALVPDNEVMFDKVRSEYTANLCANVIGQYIFGAVANLSNQEIVDHGWYIF